MLLFRSLDYAFWALWHPLYVAILTTPNFPLHTSYRRPLLVIHYIFISFQFFRVSGRSRALVSLGVWYGAIALGYLFAQGILRFVNIFVSPVAGWLSRKQYGGLVPRTTSLPGFSLQDALPELVRFVLLLLVWCVLLRWLYFEPLKNETSEAMPSPEQAA